MADDLATHRGRRQRLIRLCTTSNLVSNHCGTWHGACERFAYYSYIIVFR